MHGGFSWGGPECPCAPVDGGGSANGLRGVKFFCGSRMRPPWRRKNGRRLRVVRKKPPHPNRDAVASRLGSSASRRSPGAAGTPRKSRLRQQPGPVGHRQGIRT
ncbi:hypothetical protein SZ55_1973 [Pseudomonas sp. FeS53a]|nr:hypothetical protein SZ55_1973 [Pseudomonas sp. FeS53a]